MKDKGKHRATIVSQLMAASFGALATGPAVCLMVAALYGCGPQQPSESKVIDSIQLNDATPRITQPPGSSSSKFSTLIRSTEFNTTLLHSLERADDYLTNTSRSALILGVYATDALYLASHAKAEECLQYVETCQRLADEIGVQDGYSESLARRLEENMGNPDSLDLILNSGLSQTKETLIRNDRGALADLIALGGLAESLFLYCEVLKGNQDMSIRDKSITDQSMLNIMRTLRDQAPSLRELSVQLRKTGNRDYADQLDKVASALARIKVDPQLPDEGLVVENFTEVFTQMKSLRSSIIR